MISKSLLLFIVAVSAQDMDPSMMDPSMMDPSMSSGAMGGMDMGGMVTGGMMTPWMHFALGDALWFSSWVPQSKGALAGAAIGLYLLAIVERWFTSRRALMELHWREQYVSFSNLLLFSQHLPRMNKKILASISVEEDIEEKRKVTNNDSGLSVLAKNPNYPLNVRYTPPFVLSHNIARGVIFSIGAFINFLFMLAVM
jgi:hypothetical protein